MWTIKKSIWTADLPSIKVYIPIMETPYTIISHEFAIRNKLSLKGIVNDVIKNKLANGTGVFVQVNGKTITPKEADIPIETIHIIALFTEDPDKGIWTASPKKTEEPTPVQKTNPFKPAPQPKPTKSLRHKHDYISGYHKITDNHKSEEAQKAHNQTIRNKKKGLH